MDMKLEDLDKSKQNFLVDANVIFDYYEGNAHSFRILKSSNGSLSFYTTGHVSNEVLTLARIAGYDNSIMQRVHVIHGTLPYIPREKFPHLYGPDFSLVRALGFEGIEGLITNDSDILNYSNEIRPYFEYIIKKDVEIYSAKGFEFVFNSILPNLTLSEKMAILYKKLHFHLKAKRKLHKNKKTKTSFT